jgi:DNA-binding beta-propeller fold protein YncE
MTIRYVSSVPWLRRVAWLPLTSLAAGPWVVACGTSPEAEEIATDLPGQALEQVRSFGPPVALGSGAQTTSDYTLFEVPAVRPVAVLRNSPLLAVTNTVDDHLEILKREGNQLRRCGAVKVGMRPVAVAATVDESREAELWVSNHISDSVSVVRVDTHTCRGEVARTLHVGDEPRDLVVARNHDGKPRVFVTTAHRGQRHAVASARSGQDLVRTPDEKDNRGLADVFVFDPSGPSEPLTVVNLFTDTPRALAVGDGVVYAAGFHTGNRTTAVISERVVQRGRDSLERLLARDERGDFIERGGELLLASGVAGVARMEGGNAAVSGAGRCVPDPRFDGFESLQQLCVQTDDEHRVSRVVVQSGTVNPACQCTSGDGTLQPTTAVIVKFFDSPSECGADFTTFPDGTRGCWLDSAPGGVATPALQAQLQSPPMEWNDEVKLGLPDLDVFAIDVERFTVERAFGGVGTILFNAAVQPQTGLLFVTNTDAHNLTRFEGAAEAASTTVRGHLHESRVTVIDPARGAVQPVHLNTHIDYTRCCERVPGENEKSFAFPTGIAFSPSGEHVYFTALGSDKLGIASAASFGGGFDNERARASGDLSDITLSDDPANPAGPIGLEVDDGGSVYVKTHFTNELLVIDPVAERISARVAFPTPEPRSIREGRHVLYDARLTSSHGDSACASCHVFGDFDSLSWDLGDPDNVTVKNPGPFATPPELAGLSGIVRDPFGVDPENRPQTPDFRSNKGPMNTQTLRGLANHGPQHWRGDRTRRFQAEPGRQPDFGSLDENSSFNEFDVAIAGLNGNDVLLDPALFQRFSDFALQVTLPPNPIRNLDNSLTKAQARARASYFGCSSMTDQQFEARECTAQDGRLVNVDTATQECFCATSVVVTTLANVPRVEAFAGLLAALFANDELRTAVIAIANDRLGLPAEALPRSAELAAGLTAAIAAIGGVDRTPGELGLFSVEAAEALSGLTGNLLGVVELSATFGTATGATLLGALAAAIPADALPAGAPAFTPDTLQSTIEDTFAVSNLNLRVLADEAARGTSAFRDFLGGCDPRERFECGLRLTDSFDSCHGCHTLDPKGNAEFGIFRPGFFGSSGTYSFEALSQMFKVPHLRNAYQKVGMFGLSSSELTVPESVLGVRKGGFFARENAFLGPQVRGFGFLHDGAADTLHRFHGATVFSRTAPGGGQGAPGAPDGFSAETPADDTRASCLASVRSAPASALELAAPELRATLQLCLDPSPLPDACFLDPLGATCESTLAALAVQRGEPGFGDRFKTQILPLCFQLGSMLEGGAEDGDCFPEGLRARAELESFMLAFDSNLAPMVGQQLTFTRRNVPLRELRPLLAAAEKGECDAALRQRNDSFLVIEPEAGRPERTQLEDLVGGVVSLGDLLGNGAPITITCYPPQPNKAEARRSAFDRGWSRSGHRPRR